MKPVRYCYLFQEVTMARRILFLGLLLTLFLVATATAETKVRRIYTGKLNVNTASAADLARLPGIGKKSADRLAYHPKGRGNGYVVTLGDKRVYLSGDTEDTPEMGALKDIDVAFLCMNLPYTMDVEQAARAVRTFKPKIVYPYHSRGSDLNKFKALVGTDLGIEVRLRDWYAGGGM